MSADTDRELLELAAKAAGCPCYRTDERGWFQVKGDPLFSWELWNPLTDDGDALRLAVQLEINFQNVSGATWIKFREQDGAVDLHNEPHNGDPCAATRRAIVRAAAEIERSKHHG